MTLICPSAEIAQAVHAYGRTERGPGRGREVLPLLSQEKIELRAPSKLSWATGARCRQKVYARERLGLGCGVKRMMTVEAAVTAKKDQRAMS